MDLVLKSGANQYIEFKGVDASFVYNEDGKLTSVLDSQAAISRDERWLTEKNQLMRFFKLVQQHLDDEGGENESGNSRISEQDLESPFIEFLNKMRLPPKIESYTWRKIFLCLVESFRCVWLTLWDYDLLFLSKPDLN